MGYETLLLMFDKTILCDTSSLRQGIVSQAYQRMSLLIFIFFRHHLCYAMHVITFLLPQQLTAYILTLDVYKAKFVFQEFISTKSKIVLLRRINHYCCHNENLKKTIDNYLAKALRLNGKRNAIVHAFWVKSDDTLAKVSAMPPTKHNKTVKLPEKTTPQDVQNIVEEIAELSQDLFDLLYYSPELQKKQT